MWKPKEDLGKLTDSKINAPMHAIVRAESLKSFEGKRKEMKGNTDHAAMLRNQRRAIFEKAENDKRIAEEKQRKIEQK